MATNRVAGITVEIGADNKPFNKVIGELNKNIKTTQNELKDVERLLKLDPTNTDLLAQRQKLLASAVTDTKSKLDAVKEAQTNLKTEFDKGNITQEQYTNQTDRLNRELVETSENLKNLEDKASKSNVVLSKISATADKVAGGFEKAAQKTRGLSTAAGSLLVAMGGAAVKAGQAADDINTLARQTGLSTEEIQKFSYASDIIDVSLETLTGSMAKLTRSMGNAANSTEVSTLSAEELAEAENKLEGLTLKVEAAQQRYSDIVSENGADSLEASIAANNLEKAELDLANASVVVEKAGNTAAKAFAALGVSITDADGVLRSNQEVFADTIDALAGIEDETQRDAYAMQIFGKSAQDLNPLILGGADALKTLGDEAEAAGLILSQDALDSANEFNDSIDKLKATAQGTFAEVGTEIATMLIPFMEDLGEAISGVLEWFRGLDEDQIKLIGTIALVIAAISPLASAISGITTIIGGVSKAMAFLSANPIILIIGAIIAAIVLLATNWDTIKEKTIEVFTAIGEFVGGVVDGIVNFFTGLGEKAAEIWGGVTQTVSTAFENVKTNAINFADNFQQTMNNVDGFLQNIFAKDFTQVFGPVLGSALNGFFANVKNIWNSIKQVFDGIITFVKGVFTGNWRQAWEGIKSIFSGVFNAFVSIAKAPLNGIIALLNGAIGAINGLIGGLNSIKFDIPKWVPFLGGKNFGLNIPSIPNIPYLAKGGILSSGSAIVGEAGPELLSIVNGGRAQVTPLSGGQANGALSAAGLSAPGGFTFHIDNFINNDTNTDAPAFARRVEELLQKRQIAFARSHG